MGGLLRQGKRALKFGVIDAERAQFDVTVLCRVFGVRRSSFYAWVKRPESRHDSEDRRLKGLIQDIHHKSRGCYGSPKVTHGLKKLGERISEKRVARLMREEGLRGKIRRRRYCPAASKANSPADNILNREFSAPAPNTHWVVDTTYLKVEGRYAFLAVVLDLFSRAIVGWSLSRVNDTKLVATALNDAVAKRKPKSGLLHHSDQGSPYTSGEYRKLLEQLRMVSSMSRPGACLDNAAMESWFRLLKAELGSSFANMNQARVELFDFIEVFYNRERIHSSLRYLTPAEFERSAERKVAA
jgi:transposase InsO family protein